MKDDHYFSEKPRSAPAPAVIKAYLRDRNYVFHTSSGIFSRKGIDKGTQLLIESMEVKATDRVLDLGCGYGPIGVVAAHLANYGEVVMTDVNKRAVKMAKRNIKENRIENAEVRQGSLYAPVEGEKFEAVLCNLPMSAGLELVYRIIGESIDHLGPGGTLQVVVRKGNARIEERMKEVFGNCRTLRRSAGYKVFLSERVSG